MRLLECCSRCASSAIQVTAWIYVNRTRYEGDQPGAPEFAELAAGDGPLDAAFCEACELDGGEGYECGVEMLPAIACRESVEARVRAFSEGAWRA